MVRDDWRRVTRQDRCPICDGADNCSITKDGGAVWCGRINAGSVRQNAGGQFLHILHDNRRVNLSERYEHPSHRRGSEWKPKVDPEPRQSRNWLGLMQVCIQCPGIAAKRDELAEKLGVHRDALDRLKVGWCNRQDAWMIPERDGSGRIIGVVRRYRSGKKLQMPGAARGLTYADGWQDDPGPVFLVEGASDVAAMLSAGLCAIGRPSNTGGAAHLCDLLCRLPSDRQVIVLGENDRKPHDSLKAGVKARHKPECEACSICWPGHFGALSTARQLSETLLRSVDVSFPPDDAKDVRDMLCKLEGVS